jgi:hypothetical protein
LAQQTKKKVGGINLGIDPMRTPILYADAIRITSGENGFVLDVAQRVAGTNQAVVVARVGFSKEHAKKLSEKLAQHVVKQGAFVTSPVKIIN